MKIPSRRDIQTGKKGFILKKSSIQKLGTPSERVGSEYSEETSIKDQAIPDYCFSSNRLLQIKSFLSTTGFIDTQGLITYSSPLEGDVV